MEAIFLIYHVIGLNKLPVPFDLDKTLSWVLDLKSANDLKLFICIHDVLKFGWYLDLKTEKLSAPAKFASDKVIVISLVYCRQREVIL